MGNSRIEGLQNEHESPTQAKYIRIGVKDERNPSIAGMAKDRWIPPSWDRNGLSQKGGV